MVCSTLKTQQCTFLVPVRPVPDGPGSHVRHQRWYVRFVRALLRVAVRPPRAAQGRHRGGLSARYRRLRARRTRPLLAGRHVSEPILNI